MTSVYIALGATVAFIAVTTGLIVREPLLPGMTQDQKASFTVSAQDTDARAVILDWDAESPLVKAATAGRLDKIDGGVSQSEPVDRRILRRGSLEYRRRTEDVFLRLTLLKGEQVLGSSSVRLTGAPATPPGQSGPGKSL